MIFFNYNGKLFADDTPVITADNRGLRYGDGLFETLKYRNNEFILLDEHLSRLWDGMSKLRFDRPKLLTPQFVEDEMQRLLVKNKMAAARVRLNVFRGKGGLYDAKNHQPNYIIETLPLETTGGHLNSNGLQLCIYKNAIKAADSFSSLKHNNFLPYSMAALHAKQHGCNDALLLNQSGGVTDSTIANIFIVKDEVLYTPSLQEGCVAGTIRSFLIKELHAMGWKIAETRITQEALLNADEVFLTNAIYNIRWVSGIEDRSYTNLLTSKIFRQLASTFPRIIC